MDLLAELKAVRQKAKPGDLVVTKGAYGMDDGTKVKIVAAGAEDDATGDAKDEKPSAAEKDKN